MRASFRAGSSTQTVPGRLLKEGETPKPQSARLGVELRPCYLARRNHDLRGFGETVARNVSDLPSRLTRPSRHNAGPLRRIYVGPAVNTVTNLGIVYRVNPWLWFNEDRIQLGGRAPDGAIDGHRT